MLVFGWRIPFLCSALTCFLGYYIRQGLPEPHNAEVARRKARGLHASAPSVILSSVKPLLAPLAEEDPAGIKVPGAMDITGSPTDQSRNHSAATCTVKALPPAVSAATARTGSLIIPAGSFSVQTISSFSKLPSSPMASSRNSSVSFSRYLGPVGSFIDHMPSMTIAVEGEWCRLTQNIRACLSFTMERSNCL
jgi:hypothetical protein